MTRIHDRTHFYKFATFNTACKIIETCRLRWSSPLIFNDPFDHQIEFSFGFNQREFTNAFIDEMEKLIFGPEDIHIDDSTYFGNQLKLLRENRKLFSWNKKQNWIEIRKKLQMEIENIKANDEFANGINNQIKSELESTRVLCVTENCTNVVMWSHYAESHKGVAFKLNCIEELDNNLLAARKVNYSKKLPIIASLQDWIKHLTGQNSLDLAKFIVGLAYTKSKDWAYEEEWRLSMTIHNNQGDRYTDYRENPLIFSAILLGCNMLPENEKKIIKLLNKQFKHVEVFKAHKSNVNFGLEFERIK